MAVQLASLVERFKASVNPPGEEPFSAENEDWIAHLGNAFWWAHMRGFAAGYRLSVDGLTIENTTTGGDDLTGREQQVVVMFAAMLTIEAKLLTMPTYKRSKAGPVESEIRRSAETLAALLKARRKELDDIRDEIVAAGGATTAYVIDQFCARSAAIGAGDLAWVN